MLTEADLLKCTTHEAVHLNGGKEWFGYIHRCNQHPRLTRMDKYIRKTRGVETTWNVDGKPLADLAEAARLLSSPYEPTPDELALLSEVPDEYTRFENRSRFLPLRDVGLIEFKDGACRRTDAGRSALTSPYASTPEKSHG
jgi:hypothetical protein